MEEPGLTVAYKVKDVAYECNIVTGRSRVKIGERITEYRNPIEGFNSFWGSAGFQLLEGLRDKLAEHGFDRWTGERRNI
jgi:hypothetical protein